ncbi:Dynein light chain 1, cytoplasmic [Echinococcus granulosus]|uniref:Dynein light chain n=1 Tax=Echinococcus granulosus TaxID=6210 RepID=W6UG46_ECHGR|nr:Dynein light chain 1, cytoplasmic [Echinococcus granulosus]EUB60455.1 Dynein light chain 1, cytoplasmic [Echinococcus granulosus]
MSLQKLKIDCEEGLLDTAIEAARKALSQSDSNRSRASYVRRVMDEKYGQAWCCVVGRDFGSELPYLPNHFAFFTVDNVSFLVCKSSENVIT